MKNLPEDILTIFEEFLADVGATDEFITLLDKHRGCCISEYLDDMLKIVPPTVLICAAFLWPLNRVKGVDWLTVDKLWSEHVIKEMGGSMLFPLKVEH